MRAHYDIAFDRHLSVSIKSFLDFIEQLEIKKNSNWTIIESSNYSLKNNEQLNSFTILTSF